MIDEDIPCGQNMCWNSEKALSLGGMEVKQEC